MTAPGQVNAGYSTRPLVRKLGLKEGMRAVFSNEPESFRADLGPLPEGVTVSTVLRGEKDYVHVFATRVAELSRKVRGVVRVLHVDGLAWLSWPKKSAGVATDLDGNVVRRLGLDAGLVDVKVCAVDETWSGLKFVFRKEDRARLRAEREAGRSTPSVSRSPALKRADSTVT